MTGLYTYNINILIYIGEGNGNPPQYWENSMVEGLGGGGDYDPWGRKESEATECACISQRWLLQLKFYNNNH